MKKKEKSLLLESHLPACSCVSVVGEIGGYPVVDVAQSHPFPLTAIDGERYEGSVRVRWLGVVVAVGLRLERVQPRREVYGTWRRFTRLRSTASPAGRLSRSAHFAILADIQPCQPVHGSQATVQLQLRHGSSCQEENQCLDRKASMETTLRGCG